ncbi:MAG: DUF1080 domain-containing protein [Phycisphaeraceae bacterium]
MKASLLTACAALLLITTGCKTAECCGACKKTEKTAAYAEDKEWTVLFDGTSTEHFRGYKKEGFPEKGWVIEDGALRKVAKAGGGDIITKEKYDSFELYFEWKVAKAANSGIMYRVAEINGPSYKTGPEYQILEDSGHRDGKNAKTSTAALYALIACNDKKELKPIGEWNSSGILIQGDHVEHWLNGKKVVEYTWASDEVKELIANSKFKNWPEFMTQDTGHIAFQDHGDDVWFRNIKIRKIESK